MAMATSVTHWTADMVRALPDDGNRYEVVDGALLVTPGPSWQHQRGVIELFLRLREYVATNAIGYVMIAPADVELGPDRMVQPDLFVVPLVDGRPPHSWEEAGRLLLAVEILSPATARADRIVKRRLYQREGVPEYWIVDVDARLIERWRPEYDRPEILTDRLEWRPDPSQPATPTLELDLPAYFAEVYGE